MFVNQKSQEISYALIRVAAYIRRQELRQRIERLSFQLLEEVARGDFEIALKSVSAAEELINMGKSIYEIEPNNAKVILGELNTLNAAMRQITGLDELPHLDAVFSKQSLTVQSPKENKENNMDPVILPGNGNGINATIRQSAILEKIRQSEGRQIQLKDILAAFPEVSERTMRYDLQKLCSQGLIERVGNGGPGSYYLLKNTQDVI